MDRVARSARWKNRILDLFPSYTQEPKIEGLDLCKYGYICIAVWFELKFSTGQVTPKPNSLVQNRTVWLKTGHLATLSMFWDMTDFCMKLLKTEWKVNQWGRRSIQMLHDLVNDGGFVALKRAAEDRDGWRHRKDVKNRLYCRRLLMMTGRYPNRHYSAVVLRPMINFAHDDRDSLITIMHL